MIDSRSLGFDETTGVETIFHFDDADDSFIIEERQANVDHILEHNKRAFNDATSGWKGDMHHVATLPLVVLHDLKKRGILDDTKAFKRWLADSDNRVFRTKAGNL